MNAPTAKRMPAQAVHGQRVRRDLHHHTLRSPRPPCAAAAAGPRWDPAWSGWPESTSSPIMEQTVPMQARFAPGGSSQNGLDQEADGGLALGAGDADELQTTRRDCRKTPAAMYGSAPCRTSCAPPPAEQSTRNSRSHHQRRRALLHRLRRKVVRVRPQTGGAEKQRARRHLSRIGRTNADFRSPALPVNRNNTRNSLEQRIQFHSENPL